MRAALLGVVGAGPGPVAYAFTLGLVAALNPCGFPLLPAYLASFAGPSLDQGPLARTARGLLAGASLSAGFVVVFGLLGVLVASGVTVVVGWVPWVMIALAGAMTAIGIAALAGRELHLALPVPRIGRSSGALGMAGFGIAYAVASLSCALPLFLAGVAGSFTRLGPFAGMATFVAYALGMGVFMVAISVVVAHAGATVLRRLRPLTRALPRVSGGVLALVGVYLVIYWVSDLAAPGFTSAPVQVVEDLQSALSSWLEGSARPIGIVFGVVTVVSFLILAFATRPRSDAVARGAPRPDLAAGIPEVRTFDQSLGGGSAAGQLGEDGVAGRREEEYVGS